MESLYLLIPLSLVLVGVSVWIFFKMSDAGQFDDMDGPAHSILMDDDRAQGVRDTANDRAQRVATTAENDTRV